MHITKCENDTEHRVKLPISTLEGNTGANSPGEHEIRRKEYSERAYEKISDENQRRTIK